MRYLVPLQVCSDQLIGFSLQKVFQVVIFQHFFFAVTLFWDIYRFVLVEMQNAP